MHLNLVKSALDKCHGTFNSKGSNISHFLPLCAVSQGLSLPVPYQFLEYRNEQSCMQFSGLRSWERSSLNSRHWLPSVTFYLQDCPFCCSLWNYILNGWVVILLKIYKHANKVSANKVPLFHSILGSPASFFFRLLFVNSSPRSQSVKTKANGAQTGTWRMPLASGRSDYGPTEVGKCRDMGQTTGKPHHFFTWLHLLKVQGVSVSCQQIEAYLQTVVEHIPDSLMKAVSI